MTGGNYDISKLARFENIETILGSTGFDTITISNSQLASVKVIDSSGGSFGDNLLLVDAFIDLRHIAISNFTEIFLKTKDAAIILDDIDTGKLINGRDSGDNTLTLELTPQQGILSDADREIIHGNGIETIISNGVTTTHHAPLLGLIEGDKVKALDNVPIFVDAARDGTLVAQDGGLLSLVFTLSGTNRDPDDTLGIDIAGSITLDAGLSVSSRVIVTVNGVATDIGEIALLSNDNILIHFNNQATSALVQELIHALTYTRSAGSVSGDLTIRISVSDLLGLDDIAFVTINPPPAVHVLTAGNDAFTGDDNQDIFQANAASLNAGDQLDGAGAVDDTLELLGGGTFNVWALAKFEKIETILGSAADDYIFIKDTQLPDIKRIDGNGNLNGNALYIFGSQVDLSNTDIVDMRWINLITDGVTITLDDILTAKSVYGFATSNDKLILTQGILNDADRLALHRQGIDTITNNNVTTTHAAPSLLQLNDDHVAGAGVSPVHLDSGVAATLTVDDGLLSELGIAVRNLVHNDDILAFDVSGDVKLSAGMTNLSRVSVGNVDIGDLLINDSADIVVQFNAFATPDLVEKLLHALTYANSVGPLAAAVVIDIYVKDAGARKTTVSVTVDAPVPGVTFVLTGGTDLFSGGAGDDIFQTSALDLDWSDQLDGAGGTNDTLELLGGGWFNLSSLAKLEKIETILGSAADDYIQVASAQLADIKRIDGNGHVNGDGLTIVGSQINLSNVEIAGIRWIELVTDDAVITLDDIDTAKKVLGLATSNDTLVLTHGVLDASDRLALHRQGIDTIINNNVTTTHVAPTLLQLDGDHVTFGGGNAVHLDSGIAATLSSDDGLLSEMGIAVRLLHTHDVLGFDVSGSVKLSSGMSNQSKVTVDNVEIGELLINHAANIVVLFNASATPDLVEKLIRALTYANTGGPLASAVVIDIYVQDVGARVADVSVTVDAPLVLTAGTDVITGGAGDDIFRTTAANLNASDQLDGAGGAGDTLELLGGGTFNLSPLAKFEKIETILGSTGDDVIMIDKSQLADLRVIDGHGTTAIGDDKLQLTGVAIDFTATSVVGIDIIELVTDGANITVDDKIIAKHITGFAAGENELILAHGNTQPRCETRSTETSLKS